MSAVMRPGPARAPSPGLWLGWCAAIFMIAGALLPLVPQLASPGAPLVLEVAGAFERIDPREVHAALAGQLHGDFYRLDLNAVRAAVEALPWVAAARVERAWPGTVRVSVEEHRPYARWNGTGLLSEAGTVFMPGPLADDTTRGLPRLSGPKGRELDVREAFETLRRELAHTPFVPAGLALDERGEWTAVTADGIELKLGRGAPPETVARAVANLGGPVRMALAGRLQEVAYVDLHYINGFAVGWRSDRAGVAPGAESGAPGGDD